MLNSLSFHWLVLDDSPILKTWKGYEIILCEPRYYCDCSVRQTPHSILMLQPPSSSFEGHKSVYIPISIKQPSLLVLLTIHLACVYISQWCYIRPTLDQDL